MRDVIVLLAVAVASSSAPAWAAEDADPNRNAVSAIGGLSIGSSPFGGGHFGLRPGGFDGGDTGLAIGGGVARDLSPRFTVEATGLYLDRGVGAWAADAGLRLNILPSSAAIVPYFAVSGGLYGQSSPERTLDRNEGGFHPPRGGRPFDAMGPEDTDGSRSGSTDGMMTLGGGARFAVGPHVFVRPDARAQFVFAGDNRVLGLFTVNFGYRF